MTDKPNIMSSVPKSEAPRPDADVPAAKKAKKIETTADVAMEDAPKADKPKKPRAPAKKKEDTVMADASPAADAPPVVDAAESTTPAEVPKAEKPKKPRAPAKKKEEVTAVDPTDVTITPTTITPTTTPEPPKAPKKPRAPAKKKDAVVDAADSTNETAPASDEAPKEVKKSSTKKEKEPMQVDGEEQPKETKKPSTKKEKEPKVELPFTDVIDPMANKDILAAMCRKYGVKVTGKVAELRTRLEEYRAAHPDPNAPQSDGAGPSSASERPTAQLNILNGLGGKASTKKAPKGTMPPVLKKLKANAQRHVVARNRFGNYEHAETHLVFDPEDRMVVGRQDYTSGHVLELCDEDIEICKQYKFNYRLPENLDSNKKGLKDIKVGEADDELNEEDLENDAFEEEGEEDGEEEDPFADEE